jgi:polyisoprenoid-binding protein YceI
MKNTELMTTKWSVDAVHSEVGFKIRHLMIAYVKGTFKTFDASIYTTGKDFTTAKVDFWIDASSINTGDVKRDEHLKSADFFDVENHKQITFFSGSIVKTTTNDMYELWGELTIKGITKNIKLNLEFGGIMNDPWGNEKAGFTVTGKLNRTDWGLVWNSLMETGGMLVSEEVILSCELELTNIGEKDLVMELAEPKSIAQLV